jgi:phosphoglucomutase
MTADWDGRIRMDPSSPYAMQRLLDIKDRFDIAFRLRHRSRPARHRHPGKGLLTANQYLAVAIDYLFRHRPQWPAHAAVGKTVVSTRMIDLVAQRLERKLYEVPVGFKWFADGLLDGSLGFGGEESAGASFLRRDGTVWTTDKDGIVPALLSAEITAQDRPGPGSPLRRAGTGARQPAHRSRRGAGERGAEEAARRIDARAARRERARRREDRERPRKAPGNGAAIGGIKVIAKSGWYAARPSGTEDIYKIYAESFSGAEHLQRILRKRRRSSTARSARAPPHPAERQG